MAMETVQANLKVTNKAQFERFTIRVRTVKRSGRLAPFRLPRATRISDKPEQSWLLNMQMKIYVYP